MLHRRWFPPLHCLYYSVGSLRVGPYPIWTLKSPGGIPTEHGGDVLGPLRDECCIPYLDDVLCYVKTFEEHVETILKVLQALQRHGVKLRPEKCDLFKQEVSYVGHLVSAEGVKVEPWYQGRPQLQPVEKTPSAPSCPPESP